MYYIKVTEDDFYMIERHFVAIMTGLLSVARNSFFLGFSKMQKRINKMLGIFPVHPVLGWRVGEKAQDAQIANYRAILASKLNVQCQSITANDLEAFYNEIGAAYKFFLKLPSTNFAINDAKDACVELSNILQSGFKNMYTLDLSIEGLKI